MSNTRWDTCLHWGRDLDRYTTHVFKEVNVELFRSTRDGDPPWYVDCWQLRMHKVALERVEDLEDAKRRALALVHGYCLDIVRAVERKI